MVRRPLRCTQAFVDLATVGGRAEQPMPSCILSLLLMKTIAKLMHRLPFFVGCLCAAATLGMRAAEIDSAQQAKIAGKIAEIQQWAADPAIVAAVAAQNAQMPAEYAAMTQDKWKTLSLLDPFVRSFSKNAAGLVLKAKKADWTSEAFVSDAKGCKVAFLAKTTSWCHAGAPKHDVPMTGKTWQGTLATDESTGLQQLQVSVPVLKDGQPIGSLVVGLSLSKI